MTFSREPLQIVEIVEPRCSRTFGVAPCTATGEPCFKGDATCKSIPALDLTDSFSSFFVQPNANRVLSVGFQPGSALGTLRRVDTAPTILNVGSGNENISPIGQRSVAVIDIADHPYNDVGYDPHLSSRSYDPMTRGSFWTKWLARNPYHVGYSVRIYDGYFGDDLSAMIMREYFIEKIDHSRHSVRITAKDILRKVTDNKPKAPALSSGVLSVDISAGASALQIAGAVLTDYPAAGWVKIGSELIEYTGRATVGTNIELTGLTRGALNTTASAQRQFDRVQRVLAYVDVPFSDIMYDLLVTWAAIPAAYITKADWDAEFLEWRELYRFTGYVVEPTDVEILLGELCRQGMANLWWDERIQKLLFRAQRPNFAPRTLTQEGDILADSLVVREHPEQRVSQVYVYYGLRNPTLSLTERASFAYGEASVDVDKERQYGEAKIKEIFCRWVQTGVIARSLGGAYLRRFRDVRRSITFSLAAKDVAEVWTGDVHQVRHFLRVDQFGSELVTPWLITSAETVHQGGEYRYTAEDNESGGLLWQWVADDASGPSVEIGCWVDEDGTDGAGNIPNFAWI